MKHCEHCGEEIKGSYLQINCEFFDEYMIEFDHGAFCCKDCLVLSLYECGVIDEKEVRENEDQQ